MVVKNRRRNWYGFEGWDACCRRVARHFSFDGGHIGPVDSEGTSSVARGDGAVSNQVAMQDVNELSLVWTAEFTIKVAS